jgi:hypothetical protein
MIPTELTQLTYREKLQPWRIIRLLPNLQRVTVAHFTRRNDAEAYLMALRRLMPTANHCLVFATQAPRDSGTVRP